MGSVKDKYEFDLKFNFPTRQFVEVAVGDMTDLEMYEANHGIDSVTDSSGLARFVVTSGPTLVVGNEVRISGFTGSNTPYNGNWTISTVVAGDFESAEVAWIATEASGTFDLLVDRMRKPLVDDAYKRMREEQIGFAEDDAKADILVSIQTTDATTTTIATIPIVESTTNIIHVDIIGIKSDGTDRATYERTQSVYRIGTGNATLIGGYTNNHTAESDVSWGSPTVSVSGNNMLVEVSGKVGTTINWVCEVDIESFS